jgi:hypothetical protein
MRPSLDEMDRITAAPPGTVQLHESIQQFCLNYVEFRLLTFNVDTDKGDIEHLITVPGKSDVILQPQPSCDPNDPLVSAN